MKIRGLFHKLLKSKYNSHFHYYCIIKSCSRNVSKKGYMACKNQGCSNPLPRRGGSKQHPSNVKPAHAAVCSEAVEGQGNGTRRRILHLNDTDFTGWAVEQHGQSLVPRELEVKWSLSRRGPPRWLSDSSAAERIALTEAGIPNATAGEINQRFVLKSRSNPPSFNSQTI